MKRKAKEKYLLGKMELYYPIRELSSVFSFDGFSRENNDDDN